MDKLKHETEEFKLLIREVPTTTVTLFVLSLLAMNLLANKSLSLPFDWLALDCGIIVSWVAFLTMDVITRHFGPKAATEISVFAMLLNLAFCAVFFWGSILPGSWGKSYEFDPSDIVNKALDGTFGGTWYVLFGSTLAFLISSLVNNYSNCAIGKLLGKKDKGFTGYALRSYLSTAISQFIDNITFALVVSHKFFGWTLIQCVTCALTGMVAELLCEVLFSGIGYKVCKRWEENGIGDEYLKSV